MSLVVLPPFRQRIMILTTTDQGTTEGPASTDEHASGAVSSKQRDFLLIHRFLAGDETAFAEMMQLHSGKLFAVAVSVVRNPSDAEEIVQDTFVRAHRGLVNFRGDSSLATWLHHITFNLARNRYWYFYRRRRQDARSLEAPVGEDGLATFAGMIADSAPDPARAASHREFSSSVAAALQRLSPCQREILTMRNSLDHSYNEIGSQLGISIGTVKSRIARARRNLKDLMLEYYPARAGAGSDTPAHWFADSRATGVLDIATR